ncbi:hypothetical protein [Aestuariispira ectoiniformans]|uniref:hypothetical protein n=1 Tax=Aestuariispira ectoiniformans TaxID=2775080 RepID=UPI00223BC0ED|nr:hypothetical protein [Aestuariispira ectoiniformans]
MAKLCAQFQESSLWKAAFDLAQDAVEKIATVDHSLATPALATATRIPTTIAQAMVNPEADITDALVDTLNDLVLLEHQAALGGIALDAKALQELKDHIVSLLEDEEDDED